MTYEDVLKLLCRMGVIAVTDITADVSAKVTAAIDPNGMGAHMGDDVKVAADALFSNKRKERDEMTQDIELRQKMVLVTTKAVEIEKALFDTKIKGAQDLAAIALKVGEDSIACADSQAQIERQKVAFLAATAKQADVDRAATAKQADADKFKQIQENAEKMAATERAKNNNEAEHAYRMANIAQIMHNIKSSGTASIISDHKLLSVGTVAKSMGYAMSNGDLVSIGVACKKAFISKYNAHPLMKHKVYHYEQCDRDLVEAAISCFMLHETQHNG